jgi:hypothetical protein
MNAESLDYICAERLTPNLVWTAEHLANHGEMEITSPLLEKLGQISVSTVRRRLDRIRQDQPRLPRKGPERANRVSRDVPMKRIAWNQPEPGHFECLVPPARSIHMRRPYAAKLVSVCVTYIDPK